jgi:hypothetical protein
MRAIGNKAQTEDVKFHHIKLKPRTVNKRLSKLA